MNMIPINQFEQLVLLLMKSGFHLLVESVLIALKVLQFPIQDWEPSCQRCQCHLKLQIQHVHIVVYNPKAGGNAVFHYPLNTPRIHAVSMQVLDFCLLLCPLLPKITDHPLKLLQCPICNYFPPHVQPLADRLMRHLWAYMLTIPCPSTPKNCPMLGEHWKWWTCRQQRCQ